MTTREFVALEKALLQQLPPLGIKGKIMVMLPMEHLVRGINFDPSAFNKKSFSVTMFMMPLFVPSSHLTLNFANRVRKPEGGDRWDAEAPQLIEELSDAIKRQAVPYLSSVQSLADFVKMANQPPLNNPHALRAIAFALAHTGQGGQAIGFLNQLLGQLDPKITWQREMADMASAFKSQLISDPLAAHGQLDAWEAETAKNLGLEEFR